MDLTVESSSFIANNATLKGGAFALNHHELFTHDLTFDFNVTTNHYSGNEAEQGGALYFNYEPPTLPENYTTYFENNLATSGYGHDIASYPFRIEFNNVSANYSSGVDLTEPFIAQLLDFNGQVVSTSSG